MFISRETLVKRHIGEIDNNYKWKDESIDEISTTDTRLAD